MCGSTTVRRQGKRARPGARSSCGLRGAGVRRPAGQQGLWPWLRRRGHAGLRRRRIAGERGRAASAVAEARGGVAQVEAPGEELASGVVPPGLDVGVHPGRSRGVSDFVRGPVRVPWPHVGRVVGEQVCVIAQPDANRGQLGPSLIQVGRDQRAGVWVDGEPAVLVCFGVLTDPLAAADNAVEGDVYQAAVEIDVASAGRTVRPGARR